MSYDANGRVVPARLANGRPVIGRAMQYAVNGEVTRVLVNLPPTTRDVIGVSWANASRDIRMDLMDERDRVLASASFPPTDISGGR